MARVKARKRAKGRQVAAVQARIPRELEREIIEWADAREVSLSEALRQLVTFGLHLSRPAYRSPNVDRLANTGGAVAVRVEVDTDEADRVADYWGLSDDGRAQFKDLLARGGYVEMTPEEAQELGAEQIAPLEDEDED